MAFVVPTVYAATAGKAATLVTTAHVSVITSLCLLVLYVLYLVYQLYTHSDIFEAAEGEGGEEEESVASAPVAGLILFASCTSIAICSDYLVEAIEGFATQFSLSPTFVSLILLPIVGNAAEHFSAITVAMKDKLDLSIGIACGSSVQIAVFVTPLMVVLSHFMGPAILTMQFGAFETVILVITVLIVNMSLRDSKTNWLEGVVLLIAYVIIAGALFFK